MHIVAARYALMLGALGVLNACSGPAAPEAATSGNLDAAKPPAAAGTPASRAASPSAIYETLLTRYRAVDMHFDAAALTPRQSQLVAKLAEATRLLDELFWQQSDPKGLELYRSLESSTQPGDQQLRRLLRYNGGRFDLIREHEPIVGSGAGARHSGANLYPADLTRAELDAYVARHPEQRAALYDPYKVIHRQGDALVAVPYHVEYAKWLEPIVRSLREAAALSEDAAFARYLRLRADALLTDDYLQSDLAWLDLRQPRIDAIFAPYETYLDGFLGVKTSYGAAVLVRDDADSARLEAFQKYVPDVQDALPLAAEDRPSKQGLATPMEVMEAPLRGGDLRHGYQAVADNLPNDPRVHEQKGSKKIFFRNYLAARTDNVVLPIAQRLLRADQVKYATASGYLTFVMMHEVSHGNGPAFARTAGGRRDIREAIGPRFSALEESKASVVSLFAVKWLADHGHFPAAELTDVYASRIADILRTVRFGVAEAHGLGDIMQFNYYFEHGAIGRDAASGRYAVDFARLPAVNAELAKELLDQEASGDRARTEAWFAKYGALSAELKSALEKTTDVPVDIDPVSDFKEL